VISLGIAGLVGLLTTLLTTPLAIKRFRRRGWGQMIREEGPKAHYEKQGTPTMGGLVILTGTILGYLLGHIGRQGIVHFRDTGVLAICTIAAFGLLGFVDDFIKIRKARNLGLRSRTKFIGQLVIALTFAVVAVRVVGIGTDLSFFRSNGVNLTDGLDGLAVGSSAQVFGAFVVIAFWQFRHPGFYDLGETGSDPFEIAIIASALFGACTGFLWWNTAPAKIFMGDTGSLMLGGAMAVFAVLLNTQLLLVLLGGLYVVETLSVILQVAVFKKTGKRIFLMAPIHHHFELAGWPEFSVIVRFWVLSGLSTAFGLGLFYADYIGKGGVP
jgi:phospho-N-acetylmuramoyl-pentapeptide-transferase